MKTAKSNIEKLREQRSMSREDLARAMGVTEVTVSAWEAGTNLPTTSALIALADHFGVTTDYILERAEGPAACPDEYLSRVLQAARYVLTVEGDGYEGSTWFRTADQLRSFIAANVEDGERFSIRMCASMSVGEFLSGDDGALTGYRRACSVAPEIPEPDLLAIRDALDEAAGSARELKEQFIDDAFDGVADDDFEKVKGAMWQAAECAADAMRYRHAAAEVARHMDARGITPFDE